MSHERRLHDKDWETQWYYRLEEILTKESLLKVSVKNIL